MKLSGHNFENDVFSSLLDGLAKDVELNTNAKVAVTAEVNEFFTSTTMQDLKNIHQEDLEFIANELNFAAERAKVAVNTEDLAKFAMQVQRENLRGKSLERAAQKFCNDNDRTIAPPQGVTRLAASNLLDQLAAHQVIPAGYDPNVGANNSITGKFMGSSKNPNTIWDTDALQKQAQIALGDEKIAQSKAEQKSYRNDMKTAQWQEHQDAHSDPVQVHKGITNTGTSENNEPIVNQKTAANSMSIFSDDRDFQNIPEQTLGEEIVAKAEARANKKADGQEEPRGIQKPKSTRDALDGIFGS